MGPERMDFFPAKWHSFTVVPFPETHGCEAFASRAAIDNGNCHSGFLYSLLGFEKSSSKESRQLLVSESLLTDICSPRIKKTSIVTVTLSFAHNDHCPQLCSIAFDGTYIYWLYGLVEP